MKNIFLNNNFENIIKNYFYKINNNYNNPYYIYHSKDFSYLYNKDEDIYEKKQKPKKRETLFQFNNKRLSYLNDSICEYYHRKRIYGNKKEVFPNIFDSLFSIKKIGNGIEVIQHDISELLKPYLSKEDFESLINHIFPSKTKDDLPKNWKNLLSLTNLYPAFRLNKLQENNSKDEDIGIIKLHKKYWQKTH